MFATIRVCVPALLLTTLSAQTVFQSDFDSAMPAQVNPGNAALVGVQGLAGFGPASHPFAGQFLRSGTGNTVTVSLAALPAHDTLSIRCLFAAIDSLDGAWNYPNGDWFRITVDGVTVLERYGADEWANGLLTRFESLASASTPIEIVNGRGVRFEPGRKYRLYLSHFGSVTDPAYEFSIRFAWDLAADRPAERQSADGWQDDFDALRSAGLVDADMAGADVLLEITRAFHSDPDLRQREIIVTLVGESMLPDTVSVSDVTTTA